MPDGVPVLGATGLTVAVKVTGCPKTVGLPEVARVTRELAALTVHHLPGETTVAQVVPGRGG
jgi:hypothetical protein